MATSSEKRERAMAAMVKHYGERRQQLNPFDEGRKYHDSFAVGYSGGYAASFLVPVAAEAKAAQAAARMPYMAALLRSVNTMKRSIKGVTIGSAMWTGGKIARRMPDVDFNVGRRVSDVELDGRAKQIVGQTADTLRNTPLPRQRRIAKLTRNTGDGDVMEWLTRNVEAPDSERYQRGLVYLRRTGAEGKQLLSRLTQDARSALLKLRDKAGLQRQLTKAWVRGDIDASDIGKATRRYDGLDAEGRAAFDDLVQHEGPDAVSVSGKLDEDAFEDVLKSDLSTARKADIVDSLSEVDQMQSFNTSTIELVSRPSGWRGTCAGIVWRRSFAGPTPTRRTSWPTGRANWMCSSTVPSPMRSRTVTLAVMSSRRRSTRSMSWRTSGGRVRANSASVSSSNHPTAAVSSSPPSTTPRFTNSVPK
ncbi:hypothetical protein [Halorhabdus tiamatea]|uniref:Uncharacterized protein n=1 Tax=Halorhabdus tiamatea SARL4B TaxID=1033806 RepID=F7PNJ1_9EURY|nr:hypothetical protein [Halorhabdus tiamatea]CCQ33770.1 conserved hypothetical protein [Halorhabdus tiamatea SARL4B]